MAETGAGSAPSASMETRRAGKCILIVDDDPDIVILIKYHLESEGYRTVTAGNGLEAFEQISKHHPDLIVLDLMMPKVDGWVVCHSVKSTPATRDIKVIILTAKTQIRSKIRGLYIMQADLYMTKPFDLDDLSGNLHKLLHLDDMMAPANV